MNFIPVDKVRVGEDDVKGAPALAEDVVLGGSEDVLVEGAGPAEGLHRGQKVHVALKAGWRFNRLQMAKSGSKWPLAHKILGN